MAEIRKLTDKEIAFMTDHTLLKADATEKDIERICIEAMEKGAGAVCIREGFVPLAKRILLGSDVYIAAVVCFPTEEVKEISAFLSQIENYSTSDKVKEAVSAVEKGALAIDMIMDIGALKGKDYGQVISDITEVVAEVNPIPVKVILENSLLSKGEIEIALGYVDLSGAAFAKSNTGFGPLGAQVEDIEIFSRILRPHIAIKPSSKIERKDQAQALYEAAQRFRPHDVRFGASKLIYNL